MLKGNIKFEEGCMFKSSAWEISMLDGELEYYNDQWSHLGLLDVRGCLSEWGGNFWSILQ